MTDDKRRRILRGGLIALAFQPASLAAWILLAPKSFYDDFPGGGLSWVNNLPPYNEHLLRDFGSANLGFAVLLIAAAVLLERRVVQVALLAFAAGATPHFIYHLTTADAYSTRDDVLSLGAQALLIGAALALLPLTKEKEKEDTWHASTESPVTAQGS